MSGLMKHIFGPLERSSLIRRIARRVGLLQNLYLLLLKLSSRGTVLTQVQSSKMYLDLRDRFVCRELYMTGVHEPGVTAVLKQVIEPRMVVVDIGAHMGYFTLLAAHLVGPGGKVFAFEPDSLNFNLLRRNVEVNSYTNVACVNKAVLDSPAQVKLFLDSQNLGAHSLFVSNRHSAMEIVDAVPLESALGEYAKHVDVIKMDIEGSEFRALQGMRGLLRSCNDLKLIIEFFPSALRAAGADPMQMLELLKDCGYHCFIIDEWSGGLRSVDDPNELLKTCGPHGHENLLFVKGTA